MGAVFQVIRGSVAPKFGITGAGLDVSWSPGFGLRGHLLGGIGLGKDAELSLEGTYGIGMNVNTNCADPGNTFEAAADAELESPLLKGQATAKICVFFQSAESEASLDGSIDFLELPGDSGSKIGVDFTVSGWFDGSTTELSGNGKLRLPSLPDVSGQAAYSDVGFAACGSFAFFSGGISYRWGTGHWELFDGCDLSDFLDVSGSHAADVGRSVPVPAGRRFVALAVHGWGGAPGLVLRDPAGHTFDLPARNSMTPDLVVVVGPSDTTYVFVRRPAPGSWTILPRNGSVPIDDVKLALNRPKPVVDAHVSGHAHHRVLTWRLRPIPGQTVRFFERAPGLAHLVATTTRTTGRVKFAEAPAQPLGRSIEAVVIQDGLERARITVARFRAARPLLLRAPSRLQVRRHGTALSGTWRRVPGAVQYVIEIRSGAQTYARVYTTRPSARLEPVPSRKRLVATVRAVDRAGRSGHPQRIVLR
jgi:hypothetical protein